MQSELISIIVPVYNMEQYLERCMESIFEQTYHKLEIILVDDGSTDRSPQMCDGYAKKDTRVKVIHKENGGLSDARNAGLAIATGEYIGYVDSDDWIEPHMYETLYQACEREQADVAICRYQSVYEGYQKETSSRKQTVLERDELLKIYISDQDGFCIYNSVWSKLFRAELVRDMVFPKGRNSEDIMYTTRAFCRAKKAVYVDEFLYNYVIDRQGSIMNQKKIQRMFDDELPFWREHIQVIRDTVSAELGDMATFYYFRRLLFYYIAYCDAYKKANDIYVKKENQVAAKKIETEWNKHKKRIKLLCKMDYVSKGDKIRMQCMSFCPKMYDWMNHLYEKTILAVRLRVGE